MARKKKAPITPVTPQKTGVQPTQAPSQALQAPATQTSTPQASSIPQKSQ